MMIVEVGALKTKVLPQHENVLIHEIWGLGTGAQKVNVSLNVMLAQGEVKMHVHEESEHVFYVILGELGVYDGNDLKVVTEGNAVIIPPGQPHQIKGTGRIACEYIVITSPPADLTK